jgi:hypothetical protein
MEHIRIRILEAKDMKKRFDTTQLVKASLFIAIGIILPQVFHSVKNAGSIFLPMHIPVLLSGFFVHPVLALCVGVITPVLSHLFTGMPSVPFLYVMIFELGAYGLLTSIMYNKLKTNIYISLVSGMLIGRVVNILANFTILHMILNRPFNIRMVATGLFITGIPGIAIQLILIPILVLGVSKAYKGASGNNGR